MVHRSLGISTMKTAEENDKGLAFSARSTGQCTIGNQRRRGACTMLDLPHVINSIASDHSDVAQFVAGDMMDFNLKADAVLLKSVLHDWSDEDCIKILKCCKEAIIPSKDAGGKIIIIDVVVGSSSEAICQGTQHLVDLNISVLTPGKERDEEEWFKMFTKYKISPVLGFRSIIKVFP
ncbi:5-pentadecatrienyl resorcinol O-methyltransferase-like [Oryza glaberrima]|nr:5-pentadecatrienyl resorcinol O-methyltransferase-like [Oryza glaberrima]